MQVEHHGRFGSTEWRHYFKRNRNIISPIHDIKLWVNSSIVNMIVEIPRGKQAKLEMSTTERFNPIKQDVKKGKLRFVSYPYPFNYGALPQTWEDPQFLDERTNALGDGDPIDACDISSIEVNVGDIIQCKVLGIWAMIDEGQTDWKVVVINVKDPLAAKLNSLEDVNQELPGVLDYYYTFLRDYKIPTGSDANEFAFDGELQPAEFALEVISETHEQWRKAISGERQVSPDELWIPTEARHECFLM